jgi:glutamine amidotransferase
MHNGSVAGFTGIKRELMLAVDPSLFPQIEGSTDSEAIFFLALTFGLTEDPPAAVERAVGLVEDAAARQGIDQPVQLSAAATDGETVWAFRYSSVGKTRSLFFSTKVERLRELHPEVEVLRELGEETRFVVSEPLRDLSGAWNEVPEGSCGIVRPGEDAIIPFQPH